MTRKQDPFLTELLSYYIAKPTSRQKKSDHHPKAFSNHDKTFVMCDGCKLWAKVPDSGIMPLHRHDLSKNNFLCVHCYARLEYQLQHEPAETALRRFKKQMRMPHKAAY